ncbi:MAG: hypothetical protein JWN43_765 [Gammaproteobacteria bacterium]|nr:hypothetical protein [Gammaproteobacteria bacterium]
MAQTFETRAEVGVPSPASQSQSAVSWAAIAAGAFVAAGVSVILVALGSGLGFASVSPWPGRGVSATTFTVTAAIWLLVTQWVSAGFGGYIAGRLRSRWIGTHVHEVFFRDTAHGLITWAVATVLIAGSAALSVSSMFGAGVHAVTDAASAGAQGAASAALSGETDYGVDKLFRSSTSPDGTRSANDARGEVARIISNAMTTGNVPDADRSYLVALVAERTGISQAEAQKRVDDLIATALDAEAKLKAEADRARKAAAEASIYAALSLLIGAFIASVAAAIGGRQRDEHV